MEFLRYTVFYFPGVASGMLTSSMFRGIGKGTYSLVQTILRTLVMQIVFTYTLGILLGIGLPGIWLCIVLANWTASLIAIAWGTSVIRKIGMQWAKA